MKRNHEDIEAAAWLLVLLGAAIATAIIIIIVR